MIINTGQRTDIPAFYADWFANRLKEGFVCVRNPYNPNQVSRYRLDPSVVDVIGFCTKNPAPMFPYMNQVWKSLSGTEKPVFVEEDEISFHSYNMNDAITLDAAKAREAMTELDEKTASASSTAEGESSESSASQENFKRTEKPEDTAYIEYSWIAKQDGPVYVYERNGMTDVGGGDRPNIAWLGNYQKGDTVTGYIRANLTFITQPIMEELCGRFRAAYADNDTLHELSEIVRSRPITVEKVKDSFLRGTFTAEEGQCLFFTIPWDEGWKLTVDGNETALEQVFGIFLAADVPAGAHTYEMHYTPSGLRAGMIVSGAALALTVLYLTFGWKGINRAFMKKQEKQAET